MTPAEEERIKVQGTRIQGLDLLTRFIEFDEMNDDQLEKFWSLHLTYSEVIPGTKQAILLLRESIARLESLESKLAEKERDFLEAPTVVSVIRVQSKGELE